MIKLLLCWILASNAYFCLWGISDYLLTNELLAILFFPFALRLGIMLHTKPKYWLSIFLAEYSVLLLLSESYHFIDWGRVILLGIISVPIVYFIRRYYKGKQWHKLAVQLSLIIVASTINSISFLSYQPFYLTFLISFTGGLLIIPICYLITNFLFEQNWIPLSVESSQQPIYFRAKHIWLYISIFSLNIYIQMTLVNEFKSFALFCLAIPIILLAFRYGWQGALLGTMLNSIALIATTQTFSTIAITDLLLSLSVQTLTGILLGLAIQHLRDLNSSVLNELNRNKQLTRQLITTEESIRKSISRELHDEIGQNITAIRTQANLLQRLDKSQKLIQSAEMIEKLSLNIYDTTKGLLNRIRPRLLDDLGLHQALQNLFNELSLETQSIELDFQWNNPKNVKLEHLLEVTIYRVFQESLNNIIKYSQANKISLSIIIKNEIKIVIQDNGIGFPLMALYQGVGLRGMRERITMLGGTFELTSIQQSKDPQKCGTKIKISLPIL